MSKKPKKKSDDVHEKLIEIFGRIMGDREEDKILMKILDVQMATVKRTNAFVMDIVDLSMKMSNIMSELHSLEQNKKEPK